MQRRTFTIAAAATLAAPIVRAQNLPSGPVRIIVGFAPGGGTDILARVIGQKLGEMWKTTVVIENKAGASGTIAADYVAKGPIDGNVLLMAHINSQAITPALQKVNYDAAKDFQPIVLVGVTPNLLICNENQPAKTVKDLVELCRKNPGKVSFGSAGTGSAQHLALEMFMLAANVKAIHVPYKGSGPMLTDLIGGTIQYSFDTMTAATPHVKSGKAIALAQTRLQRVPAYANVPTMAESGFPGFEATTWYGFAGPAKMPLAMARRMNEDVNKAMQMPDVIEKLAASGAQDGGGSIEKFGDFMHAEQIKWARIIKDGGVKGKAPSRKLPLDGVRVLDISQVMAGPYACMLLADMGADVIKIEPPVTGDQTRGAMGFKMKGPDSLGFLNMNRNKRSVALNLKSQAGKDVLLRLVKDADILLENYRPGAMKKLGLGYEVLKEVNPKLVYTSISGFGQTGPWSDRPGFDLMAQAMSGVMSVTGYPDGPPVKAGVPVADIGCALFAVYATLSAYIGAKQSGLGQHVDASLFDSALAFSIWDICDYWGTGKPPIPLGTSNKMTAPYQAMACSDGYFVMGANNQKLWVQLCKLIAREELLADERFSTIALRLEHRAQLEVELEKTFRQRPKDHWVSTFLDAGIPAGPILSYPEAFGSDHAKAREMRMEIDHPLEGTVPNIGFAVKMSGTPQKVRRHPPLLGEHTVQVLEELGIDAAQQQALAAQGAFEP